MKSLYGLCEYGISLHTVRLLKEKNITPELLMINGEEVLSNLWNRNSMKMKKIIDIIKENPNVFQLDTLYKLDECNISVTLIEKMINNGVKPEDIENITKEDLMNKFNFGNVISDRIMKELSEYKKINGEETKYDYIDFLADYIKRETSNEPINKYKLREKITSETKYPVELIENDIERLKKNGIIEEYPYGIRYVFPTLEERINSLKKDNYKEILLERFSGKTLEYIGNERNITRERVRQIISNACKNIGTIYEEKYLNAFCQYNFDCEEFQLLFKTDSMVYYYFKENYAQGSLDVFEYIKNNSISKEVEDKIYKKYNTIIFMGERIKLTKLDIINVYLKNLKNATKVDDINEELNKIFVEYGFDEHNNRALEAMIDRNNYAIATINRRFRGYNLADIDEKTIAKIENLFNLKNGYYSTLMIYNAHKDFFEEIDIRDEYELHDLIRRKIHPTYNIKFERMPNFTIGDIKKKEFFYAEILKYAPINIDSFLSYMEKDYGHKKETLKTYILKEFPFNINKNTITVEYPKLDDKMINTLKENFTEEIYTREEIENIFNEFIGKDFEKYFNKYNMDKLNYKIINNYVLKNSQKSIDECIKKRVMRNDFYEIEEKFATSTYYLILNRLESELEIIRFNENSYITFKKLEEVGIKREDIANYKSFIINNIGERKFFTISYILNNFKFNLLEEYGFENIFYESIVGSIDRIKKIRFAGTKVFCLTEENFSKVDFISKIVNDVGTIDIYKLKDLLNKEYGILIEKEDLQQIINESNLYYDKIIEKVFRNKEEYYKEVYK